MEETGTGLVRDADLTIPISVPRINVRIDKQAGTKFIKPKIKYIGYVSAARYKGFIWSGEIAKKDANYF